MLWTQVLQIVPMHIVDLRYAIKRLNVSVRDIIALDPTRVTGQVILVHGIDPSNSIYITDHSIYIYY